MLGTPYPTALIEGLILPDGRPATLRPVLPQDAWLLQCFMAALPARARRERLGADVAALGAERARAMVQVDYRWHMAFVITVIEHDLERVIAEGRYDLAGGGREAGFALAVAEAFQGLGLGGVLMQALCRAAARAGIEGLAAQCDAADTRLSALMERCGFVGEPAGAGRVCVRRRLDPAPAARGDVRAGRHGGWFGPLGSWARPTGRLRPMRLPA